ncbi:hypothetical protein [Micromonospora humidisoli]|uniref:XRE family transcriptional regulator n=1 Tax=Micromonospora humidisoli TaxID=2807622 RepID=A0ABS2JM27_9ACTN|nr:hypothetical protein [Micromonospora humidisoli]MBM7086914.1 hypothetical protein [Micromonospora humidisoli]
MPRHPDTVIAPNTVLSAARKQLPSPMRPGQCMSRSELADAVNATLDAIYSGRDVTAHYVDFRWIGKLERGEHRWPSAARRAALRQVLGATTDADIGLYSPRRSDGAHIVDGQLEARPGSWDETIHLLREEWHLLVQNDKTFGPEYALMGVSKQLGTIEALLHEVPETLQPAVVRLAAQYAESAAWLNQSLNDHYAGQRWTQQALFWARQIADPAMTAWAIYRSSQQKLAAGRFTRAVEQAEAALRYDQKLPGPMRAALRVQHAHALAGTGEHHAAMRLLDDAHSWAADRRPGKPDGEHGSYCTSGYIEVHRGACLRLARRPTEAIAVLDEALPTIPSRHRQDFASALLTKATAHAAASQPDLAAATAHRALRIARRAGARRVLDGLGQLGTVIRVHQQLPHVRAFLDELKEAS